MGQALYRKYRSRSLDDVIGQEHIVKTLKNALKSKKISHAYLFTGPRGVGKTSVARILAHEINQLPYDDDSANLDIIEIDAASNRRIDEIRDLRDKVHIAPAIAKYKVYIIDEVHMLTKEAFNALLKTLEEPPAHCIFILATTEAHKLPETIVSRTQRFTFKPVGKGQAAKRLGKMASSEDIAITEEALDLLAEHGEGSFRDSISLLDQLSSTRQEITGEVVRETLGLPPENLVNDLLKAIEDGNNTKLVKLLDSLRDQAADPVATSASISQKIRFSMAAQPLTTKNIDLLRNLLEVGPSPNPRASLEICLLRACLDSRGPQSPAKSVPVKAKTESVSDTDKPVAASLEPKEPKKPQESEKPQNQSLAGEFSMDDWPAVLDKVKIEAPSLYMALRLATPDLSEGTLTLAFQFPLHQKKINASRVKDLIARIIEELTGAKIRLDCLVDKTIQPVDQPVNTQAAVNQQLEVDEQAQTISNIFGGAELLES